MLSIVIVWHSFGISGMSRNEFEIQYTPDITDRWGVRGRSGLNENPDEKEGQFLKHEMALK